MAKHIILDTILVEEFVVIKNGIRNLISLSVFLQKRVKGSKMLLMLAVVVFGWWVWGYDFSFNFSAFWKFSIMSTCDICICWGLGLEGGVVGAPPPHLTQQVNWRDALSTWVPRPGLLLPPFPGLAPPTSPGPGFRYLDLKGPRCFQCKTCLQKKQRQKGNKFW